MRSTGSLLAVALLTIGATEASVPAIGWSPENLAKLRSWVSAAPDDALVRPDDSSLDRAVAAGDEQAINIAANALAAKLARMHLLGTAPQGERAGWRIIDSDRKIDVESQLAVALAAGRIDDFFAGQRPQHAEYVALRDAHRAETDPARRRTIARNMERWRWLPVSLGPDHLLVNTASFEASRWQGERRTGTWRVIVGKTSTPTPVFAANITGVNLNPWWNVPANIVRESVGSLIRRSPATARARGYVWSGGSVRQKPGANNALGRMKLVMPNPYSVYLHDTPNRDLFGRDVRTFSHGCVRVGDALGLAENLLAGVRTREQIDAAVASGKTVTIALAKPLPVYVAYFTAGTRADGTVALFDDVYRRDKRIASIAFAGSRDCAG